jgi:hypothetical protein
LIGAVVTPLAPMYHWYAGFVPVAITEQVAVWPRAIENAVPMFELMAVDWTAGTWQIVTVAVTLSAGRLQLLVTRTQ